MKRVALSAVLALVVNSTAALAEEAKNSVFELPDDPKALVISFDHQNGFTPPRQNQAPLLSVLADGTVLMPSIFGETRDVSGKISPDELQVLLRFAIEENKFFSFDEEKVKAKMLEVERAKEVPRIADVPDSVFEIHLADRSHKVRHYALGMAREFYKEVDELQHLLALQQRLNRLMSETRVGGKAGIERLVKLANVELKKQYPDIKALKVEDFSGAYLRRDGVTSATISRTGKTAAGKPDGTFTAAVLEIPEEGVPKVKIRVKTKS